MEKKVRFHLHKVKKRWVTVMVSTAALGLLLLGAGSVQADELASNDPASPPVEVVTSDGLSDASDSLSEAPLADQAVPTSDGDLSSQALTAETSTEQVADQASIDDSGTANASPAEPSQTPPEADETAPSSGDQTKPSVDTPRSQFVSDDQGNWYYYDANGQKLTGFQTVDYLQLYFHADGRQAKGEVVTVDGSSYYFDKDSGEIYRNGFASDAAGNWYYLGEDGKAVTGLQIIDSFPLYFYPDGVQAKDAFIVFDGSSHYFKAGSGQLATDGFFSDAEGNWYYADPTGQLVTGEQTIDSFHLYFYADGVQAKDALVERDGKSYYYDADNGRLVTDQTFVLDGKTYTADTTGVVTQVPQHRNQFVSDDQGNWYYYDANGQKLTGFQTVDNVRLYFHSAGRQAKGELVTIDGKRYYFDKASGELYRRVYPITIDGVAYTADSQGVLTEVPKYRNQFVSEDQVNWYYADDAGHWLTGPQIIDTFNLYFYEDGLQAKDALVVRDGKTYYYDADNGRLVTNRPFVFDGKTYTADATGVVTEGASYRNQFVSDDQGNWYYFDGDGQLVTGFQVINGQQLYFAKDGRQVKSGLTKIDGATYYFDPDSGEMAVNQEREFWQKISYGEKLIPVYRYFNADGKMAVGFQDRDGQTYYYDEDGIAVRSVHLYNANVHSDLYSAGVFGLRPDYLFDEKTGAMKRNTFVYTTALRLHEPHIGRLPVPCWVYCGSDGLAVTGWQVINGKTYYFYPESKFRAESGLETIDGKDYFFDSDSVLVQDLTFTLDQKFYRADEKGVLTKLESVADQFVYDLNWKRVSYTEANGEVRHGVMIKRDFVLYFKADGSQAKGEFLTIHGATYYFDEDSGEMYRNRLATDTNGDQYYLGGDGKALTDTVFEHDGKSYQADSKGIVTEKD
ncbi:KxYKxGKxW signal peptide domain-containing protein [Streptococcus sp. DD12]|uniref:KxYKxGKxW signal peptide domain-containing protein n=1 Tax=Streptococcus sp. DD12 TaxID=1777880 RepID=UPI00079BBA90|nr:KxYKxGKxW signal peptide domain-containing protein [Streptococcus sp. DD12]KXT76444.1 Choline binding protein A [Streptococcus sp. DD12]